MKKNIEKKGKRNKSERIFFFFRKSREENLYASTRKFMK